MKNSISAFYLRLLGTTCNCIKGTVKGSACNSEKRIQECAQYGLEHTEGPKRKRKKNVT
jgi:hypothetical protein